MAWIDKTSFNPMVKDWSYNKCIKVFGEINGEAVVLKFGIKKEVKKKEKKD